MAQKWNRECVAALIDAYREEPNLYKTKAPNYYNKVIRAQAWARVSSVVSLVRPNTSPKECETKLHGLRNQFHQEHKKVKSSINTGSGMNDLYKPSLWYYQKLSFLADHFIPRKSIGPRFSGQSSLLSTDDTKLTSAAFYEDAPEIQFHVGSPMKQSPRSSLLSVVSEESYGSEVLQPAYDLERDEETRAPTPSEGQSRKRCGDDFVPAAEIVSERTSVSSTPSESDNVLDNCMRFIGSMAKQIRSEDVRLKLMSNVVNIVMEAKMEDLKKSNMQNTN